jgi:hypothetical protein
MAKYLIYIETLFGTSSCLARNFNVVHIGFSDEDLCQYSMKYGMLYGLGESIVL